VTSCSANEDSSNGKLTGRIREEHAAKEELNVKSMKATHAGSNTGKHLPRMMETPVSASPVMMSAVVMLVFVVAVTMVTVMVLLSVVVMLMVMAAAVKCLCVRANDR
jgi:hypothetical protein